MDNYNETILEMLNAGKTPEAIYKDSLRVLAEEQQKKQNRDKELKDALIKYIAATNCDLDTLVSKVKELAGSHYNNNNNSKKKDDKDNNKKKKTPLDDYLNQLYLFPRYLNDLE